jgi:hypothetical protein
MIIVETRCVIGVPGDIWDLGSGSAGERQTALCGLVWSHLAARALVALKAARVA